MTVVGFDISTTRIDWAWLACLPCRQILPCAEYPNEPPCLRCARGGVPTHRFRILGKPTVDIVDRVREVVDLGLPYDMTEAAIEYPFSRYGNSASLMAVLGALTTRIDRSARVAWVSSGDLRNAIGSRNKKTDAAIRIRELYPVQLEAWDEHALDALVACVGWTEILNNQ